LKKYFPILILFLLPETVHAYLDPGSGAMLINLIVASIAASFYYMKDYFFRIFSKEKKINQQKPKVSILSEGHQYWSTFKPIIDAMIQQQIPFCYYTLDIHDPALTIENDLMHSKFLGYSSWANSRASLIKSDVLLATTPNIGNHGFPLKRPPSVIEMVHVFHSINDISAYKTGSLDAYDSVIIVGDFQIDSIRKIEKQRNLKAKKLLPLGLPYLDELVKEKTHKTYSNLNNKETVLIGSSWGSKGCLQSYGTDFIKQIVQHGYNVIIRPHPQSFKSEKKIIKKFKEELRHISNIEWDESISSSISMHKADILISDTSSIRFDFAFLYKKPVITLNIEKDKMVGFEREHLEEIWTDKSSSKIGFVVERSSINQLPSIIEKTLSEFDLSSIHQLRDNTIHNFGESGIAIAKYLSEKNNNI